MEAHARRLSTVSLRRGSIRPSPSSNTLRKGNRHADGASLASKTMSVKGACGFLSGETISGLKYAVIWTVYVLIGSSLFLIFERTVETETVDSEHWVRYKELARGSDASVQDELHVLKQLLYELCPHPALQPAGSHGNHTTHLGDTPVELLTAVEVAQLELQCSEALQVIQTVTVEPQLSFVDSIYYTMTLVTTIGYGHIYPKTRIGRLFAVLFAMVGVPLTCILMAKNSNILSIKMLQVYKNLKRRYGRGSRSKLLLYLVTWVYLSIGFIVFMFVPSVAFVYLEGWTYDESLYYTFITLSTIGFGELVGAYGSEGPYSDLYKISIVVWIMIALGYWVMLLNFLQKALQTKLVPKRIRVQFKAKQLAKQAEFLRQLMTKVREQWSDEPQDDGDVIGHIVDDPRNAISLVAEALHQEGAAKGAKKMSLLPPRSRNPSLISRPSLTVNDPTSPNSPSSPTCSVSSSSSERHLIRVADDSTERNFLNSVQNTAEQVTGEETVHSSFARLSCAGIMSLADLLEADVVVRTPKVPIIRSLMEESFPKASAHFSLPGEPLMGNGALPGSDGPRPAMDEKQLAKFSKEVTLPLKDVLGLVTLVANLEGQVDGNPLIPDTSIHSTIHSMVSMDAKLPQLREAFLNLRGRRQLDVEGGAKTNAKYKAVGCDESNKLSVPGNSSNSRLFQRRGSCLDAFLDDQTKREYVEVVKEGDDKTDTMSEEMETEEIDVDVLNDDDDDTFNAPDIMCSLDDDDDDEAEEIEDFLEADDGSRQVSDDYKLSKKNSGGNAV